jgi:hypothetical protein
VARESQKRREVKTMNYVKPEVTLMGSAVEAIESNSSLKPQLHVIDSELQLTNGAYEADE